VIVKRHLAATDQPGIRDRLMRSATWLGRHHRRAVAGAAGDAVDTRGGEGFRLGSW
jgi:hypothetical protein